MIRTTTEIKPPIPATKTKKNTSARPIDTMWGMVSAGSHPVNGSAAPFFTSDRTVRN
jgi:hypothetical protein